MHSSCSVIPYPGVLTFSFGDIKVSYVWFHHVGGLTHAVKFGVATQCLKANKCKGANEQYWANVLLKYVDTTY